MLTCDHVRCAGCNRPIPGIVDRCMYCGELAKPSNDVTLEAWGSGHPDDEEEAWFADLSSLARVLCAAGEQSLALYGASAPSHFVAQLQDDLARVQAALDSGDQDALADALESLEAGWGRFSG